MQPMPSSPRTSSSPRSIQRLSIEYDGWWMSSGVPSSRRMPAACDRALRRVRRDAGVQRLALPHGRVERAERLLHRRRGVAPVRVEDVDVVQPHSLEALVQAREQVLARAEVAVGTGPHVVAGLGRDHELVAEGREVRAQEGSERLLGRAVGRPVVVGQVEVRDAEVERPPHDRAAASRAAGRRRSSATGRARRPGAAARCGRSGCTSCARSDRRRVRRSCALPRRGDWQPDDTRSRATVAPATLSGGAQLESGGSRRPAGAGVVDCGLRAGSRRVTPACHRFVLAPTPSGGYP